MSFLETGEDLEDDWLDTYIPTSPKIRTVESEEGGPRRILVG